MSSAMPWFFTADIGTTAVSYTHLVFPVSDNARDIVDALLSFCKKGNVDIYNGLATGLVFEDIEQQNTIKGVVLEDGTSLFADYVVLATGGMSYPATGSDGKGYTLSLIHISKLKRLNEIIFPYIVEEAEKEIADAKARGVRVIILDAPTLFESGADRLCDKIVVITAKDTIRLARILERDNITPDEAAARMGSQLSEQFFIEHADFVIDNTGDKVELRLAVLELLNELGL